MPKPTKTLVKILDQLKNCPFGVNIHESKERKNPISAEEFTEIMSEINQNWFEQMDASSQSLKIEGTYYSFLNNHVEGESKKSRQAQNLAISKKFTIFVLSLHNLVKIIISGVGFVTRISA